MCGIAGIIDFRGAAVDQRALADACATMRHRGPDDAGTLVACGAPMSVGLAAVRLAVVDPTPAGHQPFLYADGRYLLAYNGEVYNHRALRRELAARGRRFATQTDTEVVAAACAEWGAGAFSRFNGMFAVAFFDRVEQRGWLARDRFGIKPLLLAEAGNRLFLASEMGTLRRLGEWERTVDTDALLHYLHFGYFAAPRTIYAAARRLGPGEYVSFDAQGLGRPCSFREAVAPVTCTDYGEACGRVREALFQAVAGRRLADVPLGAFLSGGVDSAIVATHLAECTPGRIKTFSIGYAEHGAYDETGYARLMASHLGSEHHEWRLTYEEVLEALVPMLDHLGEPFFDSSILPTAIVSRLARRHVTVCLSGDGGDELFGGYWRYLGHESLAAYQRLPVRLRVKLIEPWVARAPAAKSSAWANRVRQFRKLLRGEGQDAAGRHLAWSRILAPEAEGILSGSYRDGRVEAEFRGRMDALIGRSGDELHDILAFDLRYGLPADMLHKVDLASMAHSLEVRVPFLDPEVVAAAESCPSRFRVARGVGKRMLVDAYRGRIPDAVLERAKMGFEVPVGEFLRGRLRELFWSAVTRERVESFGVLEWAGVERLYADHAARRGEHADLLFALLSLCWWRMRGG